MGMDSRVRGNDGEVVDGVDAVDGVGKVYAGWGGRVDRASAGWGGERSGRGGHGGEVEVKRLTMQQSRVIDLLLEGKTQRKAAEEVGVTEVTVSRWQRKDLAFQQALEDRQRCLLLTQREALEMLVGKAIWTVAALMDDPSGHVRLRAAMAVLRAVGLDRPEEEPEVQGNPALDAALDRFWEELKSESYGEADAVDGVDGELGTGMDRHGQRG